jgi:hypothetical protein
MNKHLKVLIGVGLIVTSFFSKSIEEKIFSSKEPSIVNVLKLEQPTKEVLDKVSDAKDAVTEKSDREKLSLINYELSKRVKAYETDPEAMLKVLNKVQKDISEGKWIGKYKEYKDKYPNSLIQEIVGDLNASYMTIEERKKLSEIFMGLAWVLGE